MCSGSLFQGDTYPALFSKHSMRIPSHGLRVSPVFPSRPSQIQISSPRFSHITLTLLPQHSLSTPIISCLVYTASVKTSFSVCCFPSVVTPHELPFYIPSTHLGTLRIVGTHRMLLHCDMMRRCEPDRSTRGHIEQDASAMATELALTVLVSV